MRKTFALEGKTIYVLARGNRLRNEVSDFSISHMEQVELLGQSARVRVRIFSSYIARRRRTRNIRVVVPLRAHVLTHTVNVAWCVVRPSTGGKHC